MQTAGSVVINSKFISSEGKIFKKSDQALLLLRPGDIAMVLSDVPQGNALAKCYLVEKENTFTLNQRICVIRSQHFQPKFLFYQLNRNKHFLAFDNGENQTNLRLNQVLTCPLFLPPLPEQHRIVGIVDEAFEGIATAKDNAEKNIQNARAIFESHLQSIFTRYGEGWVEKTLDDVCKQITDGKHGDCKEEAGSGYYFLSAKDVKDGTLNYEKARQITRIDFEETHRRTNLEPGDLLITNSGTIGRMAVAPSDERTKRTTFQKSVAILKPITTLIDSKFMFYCLSAGLTRFVNLSAGTAQKNLLLRDLRSYCFALPKSIDQQKGVADKLDALQKETQRLEAIYQQKLSALDELKKSLLHQAFTGELNP